MAGDADIDMDSVHACDIDTELEYGCSESDSENEETSDGVMGDQIKTCDARDGVTHSNTLIGSEQLDGCRSLNQGLATTPMRDFSAVEEEKIDESVEPPRVGLIFGSIEELERYYRRYAKQQGFGITKTSMGRKGKIRDIFCNVTWKCWCAGKPDMRRKRNGKRVVVGNEDGCPKITILPANKPSTRKSRTCVQILKYF